MLTPMLLPGVLSKEEHTRTLLKSSQSIL